MKGCHSTPGPALLLALGAFLVAGCGDRRSASPPTAPAETAAAAAPAATNPPAVAPDPRLLERGRDMVTLAFSVLSSNLTAAIARGGAASALEFCSVNVSPLTASVAGSGGVEIRRVTHRARNPANRASETELALLREYQRGLAAGRTNPPTLVPQPTGRVTYYAPILLNNPLCLQCHGEPGREIAADTLAAIDRLYPRDEARGFRLNELRGMWAITLGAPDGPGLAPAR